MYILSYFTNLYHRPSSSSTVHFTFQTNIPSCSFHKCSPDLLMVSSLVDFHSLLLLLAQPTLSMPAALAAAAAGHFPPDGEQLFLFQHFFRLIFKYLGTFTTTTINLASYMLSLESRRQLMEHQTLVASLHTCT